LYDLHAEECARAAEQTDNPKHREMLIKLAMQLRQEAQHCGNRRSRTARKMTAKRRRTAQERPQPHEAISKSEHVAWV
jgi:hypothetical protein